MGRRKEPFITYTRNNSPYWYFKLAEWKTAKSSGIRVEDDPDKKQLLLLIAEERNRGARKDSLTLQEFAGSMFIPGLCQWTDRKLDSDGISRTTVEGYRRYLEKYILKKWGSYRLSAIEGFEVDDWIYHLPYSSSFRNHCLLTFQHVMREAVRRNQLQYNPLSEVESYGTKRKKDSTFSPLNIREMNLLFPESPDVFDERWPERKYGIMALLAATTGMRGGEVRAIHWKGLHFDLRGVEIVQSMADKGRQPGQVKNNEVRVSLYPERTEKYLRDWQSRSLKGAPHLMVFPGKHGVYMDRSAPNEHLKRACFNLGIDAESRKITFHSLRHSFNQRMLTLSRGRYHDNHGNYRPDRPLTSDEVVRMFTGHRSGQMTRLYANPLLLENLQVMQPMREMVDQFFDVTIGQC